MARSQIHAAINSHKVPSHTTCCLSGHRDIKEDIMSAIGYVPSSAGVDEEDETLAELRRGR